MQIQNKKKKVIVGMSGGVDSSVSALLLKQQGYDVMGLFMKNWEDDDQCPAETDYQDAMLVAKKIDIPLFTVNFAKEYKEKVFTSFIQELAQGFTPNPDILCNREIKFGDFLAKALSMGADYIATGHYAQNIDNSLVKGCDPFKDQTYFLYTIKKAKLAKTLFPIGHLEKSFVRKIAQEADLITSNKKDSTGICFIGKRDFKSFVHDYLPFQKGHFIDEQGKVLGEHDGVAYYTLGQRKGLGVGGPGDAWFVAKKDLTRNTITLVQGQEHPALYATSLRAGEISWVDETFHPKEPFRCLAKIRYRQEDHPCTVYPEDDALYVVFDTPQRSITPRQALVLYTSTRICLGGALIKA